MPKIRKKIENCKHPNSRKTISLVKQVKKNSKREKQRLGTHIKHNLIGEKILWFKNHIPDGCISLSKKEVLQLIETYLARFNEELEQIELKNSVGARKNRQYASREDVIKLSKEREIDEFNGAGVELPDLFDANQLQVLMSWNGELRYLQNFKLKRFSKKNLIE